MEKDMDAIMNYCRVFQETFAGPQERLSYFHVSDEAENLSQEEYDKRLDDLKKGNFVEVNRGDRPRQQVAGKKVYVRFFNDKEVEEKFVSKHWLQVEPVLSAAIFFGDGSPLSPNSLS